VEDRPSLGKHVDDDGCGLLLRVHPLLLPVVVPHLPGESTRIQRALSSLPFLVGACANFGGGLASNVLVRRLGLTWGRRSIGVLGLGIAAACIVGVIVTQHWLGTLVLLSLAYGGITFQQPTMFAVCLDIGGEYAGAVVGAMNTAAQVGSFVGSLAFGYLVDRSGSYTVPFFPMAAFLLIGAWLWLKVDPNRPVWTAATVPALAEARWVG
jgi:MFS transporter, ACS family, glucarate transporter